MDLRGTGHTSVRHWEGNHPSRDSSLRSNGCGPAHARTLQPQFWKCASRQYEEPISNTDELGKWPCNPHSSRGQRHWIWHQWPAFAYDSQSRGERNFFCGFHSAVDWQPAGKHIDRFQRLKLEGKSCLVGVWCVLRSIDSLPSKFELRLGSCREKSEYVRNLGSERI